MAIKLLASACSDKGCVRKNNEDSFCLNGHYLTREKMDGYFLLNASVRYDLKIKDQDAGLYLFVNGHNLLDSNYCVGSLEPRAGREIMFGLGGKI